MKMKKILLSLVALFSLLNAGAAVKNGAEVTVNGYVCRVQFYSPDIVRVLKYPASAQAPSQKSLVVTLAPEGDLAISQKESGSALTLSSGALTAVVNKKTGNVQFLRKGKNLLKEKAYSLEKRRQGVDKDAYKVNITFQLDKEEPIYGLGTIQDGKLNRRGTSIFMEQSNLQDFQYVVQSIKGWGVYYDNYSRADFKDDAQGMSFKAEVGDAVDYYFMYGGDADGVNACMRQLSGCVPMFPLWTYGYWQSRERYKSSDEVREVVDTYRKLHVPLDGIIQDWQYWGSNYLWNGMEFLNETFADGPQLIKDAHKQNAHFMISIWSNFGPQSKPFRELAEKNLLFNFETWPQSGLPYWPPRMDYPSGVKIYDVYSSTARDIYWNNLKRLFDAGVDGWWMDSTDPDYFNPKDAEYETPTALGSWRRMRNAFPLCAVSGVYDHQRQTTSDKRVFIMTRSAFAGQQRYGSNMWSGDVASSWDMFRKQIPLGLNFSMTGNPNFNTDIGGFFAHSYNTAGPNSACHNPQYQELYVRWMQYGFFCPVFRSHGTEAYREIYQFGKKGEPIYDAIEKTIRLRYRFLPYLYATAWQATNGKGSYLRALVSDFPSDKKVWNLPNEFLFGKNILAMPIDRPQYTEEKIIKVDAMTGWNQEENTQTSAYAKVDFEAKKSVNKYLPAGAQWYDFWTNQLYKGGKSYDFTTRIDEFPMLVKAGSILPLGPEMEYVGQKSWDDLEIRVYPGADATFTLYEDEGDNYNYEQGAYTTISFKWDNKRQKLTIGAREGEYPGMLKTRKFHVNVIGKGVQEVVYDGNKIEL